MIELRFPSAVALRPTPYLTSPHASSKECIVFETLIRPNKRCSSGHDDVLACIQFFVAEEFDWFFEESMSAMSVRALFGLLCAPAGV